MAGQIPSTSDIRPASGEGIHFEEEAGANILVQHLHGLVTYGPGDLDIACAMSDQGYDSVKWAEGQGMLAELVTEDTPPSTTLAAAVEWYDEAVTTARRVLAAQPQLLAKLGLT